MARDSDSPSATTTATPQLTPFDKGELLEPELHAMDGMVDFDNDESATELTVWATPHPTVPGGVLLHVARGTAGVIGVEIDGVIQNFVAGSVKS